MVHRYGASMRAMVAGFICLILLSGCGVTSSFSGQELPTFPSLAVEPKPDARAAPTPRPGDPAPTVAAEPTPVLGEPKSLREDIQIRKVMETGGGFVRMKRDPTTNTLYYMDDQVNIYRLDLPSSNPSKGTPVYTRAEVGVEQRFTSQGMAFGPDGTLYVLGNINDKIMTHATIRKGVADASGKRTWTTLAETAPYEKSNTQFDHVCNGIVVSPDGLYLYMNSGSRTDHGEVQATKGAFPDAREVPLTSAIFRIPTDTDNQVLPNDEAQLKEKGYLFADGTRNSFDPAFAPNGDLFAGDNGPDADFPDELNWLREGHHYGFPWRFGNYDNPQQFPNYDPSEDGRLQQGFFAVSNHFYANDPTFPPPPPGVTFTDPVANLGPDANVIRDADGNAYRTSEFGEAAYSFTPHRSPLGLVFDAANAVGGGLTGDGFILSWGAAAGDLPDQGRDLLDIKLTKLKDSYQAKMTQLVVGFDHPIDADLIQNRLYVLENGGKGTIWEVTLPAHG